MPHLRSEALQTILPMAPITGHEASNWKEDPITSALIAQRRTPTFVPLAIADSNEGVGKSGQILLKPSATSQVNTIGKGSAFKPYKADK